MNGRDQVDRALTSVLSNAMNYPDPTAMLGKDTAPLRRKVVDAAMPLLAEAWGRGYDAGEICAMDAMSPGHVCQKNPYRIEGAA